MADEVTAGAVLMLTDVGAAICIEEDEAPPLALVRDEYVGAVAAFTLVGAEILVVELPLHEHPLVLAEVTDGAVCTCAAAGAPTDVAEEPSPLVLDELVTTEGAVAAAMFTGADTVVEPAFWPWLPALCREVVTEGAAASCTAVGADTDVVCALDPLDWPQVHPLFRDVVVIAGAVAAERVVGAATLVLCVLLDPLVLDCDVTLGDVLRTTPVGAEMAVDEVAPSAKAAPEKSMIPRVMPPAATTGRMSDRMGSLKSTTSS